MTFNEYQEFTKNLAVYNEAVWLHYVHRETAPQDIIGMPWAYPAFAIAEEAGEVCGKIAKFIRKSKQGADVQQLKLDVAKELGDVMYQVSETARQMGWTLEDIVRMNVEKLSDRKDRGVLVGEGDNR